MSSLFSTRRWAAMLLMAVAGLALADIHGCFNPAFVNGLSGGRQAPLAPGSTPYIQVLVINSTTGATVDFRFGWTPAFQGFNTAYQKGIAPQMQHGTLLGCPINQIGLGNPQNLSMPAMVVYRNGEVTNVPASAFPLVFRDGIDYICGDTLVLGVIDDPTSGFGVKIVAGRVDGVTQTGPFSGPDTFQIVQALILANGTPPIPVP